MIIDPDLLQYGPEVSSRVGRGGGHDVFGIEPRKLVKASGGVIIDLKRA